MKYLSIKTAPLLGAAAIASCGNMKQIKHQPYPVAERGEVADNYFGTEVPDPYRWLEDDNSEATAAKRVAAENAVTQTIFRKSLPRGYPRAADPIVELCQGERSAQARRLVLLYV